MGNFLFSAMYGLGCMVSLNSDQGTEFVNRIIDELTAKLQVNDDITSAYLPESDGEHERQSHPKRCPYQEHG